MANITKYTITAPEDTRDPEDWTLQGSNDDIAWDVVDTVTGQSFATGEKKTFTCDTPGNYRYYLLDVTKLNGTLFLRISEIELIVAGTTDECPTMTAADAPIPCVVTASTEYNGPPLYAGWHAFDDSVAPDSNWTTNFVTTGWIKFDFGEEPGPTITSITPDSEQVGDPVTIAGTGYGAAQGASTVTFNGVDAGVATAWSDTEITIDVPAGATTGDVIVTTTGGASPGFPFTVLPSAPTIVSVLPDPEQVGNNVTITGADYGAVQGASTVTFNGTNAGVAVSWSDTSIVIEIPLGASTGNVIVTVGGDPSAGYPFTVASPVPTPGGPWIVSGWDSTDAAGTPQSGRIVGEDGQVYNINASGVLIPIAGMIVPVPVHAMGRFKREDSTNINVADNLERTE